MNFRYLAAVFTLLAPIVAASKVDDRKLESEPCFDEPGWSNGRGSQYDCAWYKDPNSRCDEFDYEGTNGLTAQQACCDCGGGWYTPAPTPPPTADERVCLDIPDWNNGRGDQYTCEWYANDADRCEWYDYEGKYQLTPDKACCSCGGGFKYTPSPTPPPTTRPPTPSPTRPPTNPPSPPPTSIPATPAPVARVCTDESGWNNGRGSQYDCEWYAMNKDRCETYDFEGRWDLFPNEACCACGGGQISTPAPTPVVKVCEDDPSSWNNGRGSQYDCEWYAESKSRCDDYNIQGRYGYYPDEACCACGGGKETAAKPTSSPMGDCDDIDAQRCGFYEEYGWDCDEWANENCCSCGGGEYWVRE